MTTRFAVFAGSANPGLAREIAEQLGVELGACSVERFPDGEVSVRIEEPVRMREVYVVQSVSPPVDENLVELLAFADACRRSSAARVTAVIPYFGYSRSDKRHGRREPIMASVVATVLQAAGVDHVVTLDLHAPQIEGFFRVPVDSLTAVPTLCAVLTKTLPEGAVVVSPDAGRVKMATAYANRLGTSVVVLHKRRESGAETRVTHLVGDVRGRPCILVDDMISTAGTIAESVAALMDAGALPRISVAATHGLFLEGAADKLNVEQIGDVLVTDTVRRSDDRIPSLRIVSVAPLIAEAIRQMTVDGSLGGLY